MGNFLDYKIQNLFNFWWNLKLIQWIRIGCFYNQQFQFQITWIMYHRFKAGWKICLVFITLISQVFFRFWQELGETSKCSNVKRDNSTILKKKKKKNYMLNPNFTLLSLSYANWMLFIWIYSKQKVNKFQDYPRIVFSTVIIGQSDALIPNMIMSTTYDYNLLSLTA